MATVFLSLNRRRPEITDRMASDSRSFRTGLLKKPSIPASRHSSRSLSDAFAVIAMMGVLCWSSPWRIVCRQAGAGGMNAADKRQHMDLAVKAEIVGRASWRCTCHLQGELGQFRCWFLVGACAAGCVLLPLRLGAQAAGREKDCGAHCWVCSSGQACLTTPGRQPAGRWGTT